MNHRCKHQWIPVTSPNVHITGMQMVNYDEIVSYVCKKCNWSLSPSDYKDIITANDKRFDRIHKIITIFLSVAAIIISIVALVVSSYK